MEKEQLIKTLDEYFGTDKKFVSTARIPLICQDISMLRKMVENIDKKLDDHFVNKDEYWPVKTIVYGAVGIILVAVMSALVYLVVNHGA